MKKTIIKLENVWKIYKLGEVDVYALRGLNLTVKEGEFVAIIGPSGAGKSTTLNMIGCLDLPTKGKVYLDGKDVSKLSEELGVPVVPMVAIKKLGFRELIDELVKRSLEKRPHIKVDIVDYGPLLEEKIRDVEKLVSSYLPELASIYVPRWIAIKLLERDPEIEKKIAGQSNGLKIIREVNKMRQGLQEELGVDIEEYIIEKRYAKVSEILRKVLVKKRALRTTLTDLVDFIVTHRIFGIPVMLTIFYMMFQFAFTVATPLSDLIDFFFSNILYTTVQNSVLPGILKSLIADVIITGIGSILVFLPNIAFLFLALAVLEDVGYMSRAAFVVDKLMHKLGLTGKAIIPMIIGFGCNVPAVMATRTIEDENDRKTAVLINPLMSCSARLPVYLILAGAFFAGYASSIVLTVYILGVVLAVGVAVFLRKLVFKAPSSGFIMELPPYMVPMMSNIGVKTWERTKKFLFKAGTVILLGVLLTWALSVYGPNGYIGPESLENPRLMEKSWVGVLGHALEKVFWPMGWDWRAAAALFFGFIAKEVVVGTMAMLYGVGEGELPRVISTAFTPTTAYAYMAFVLIYVPCLATVAAIRGELGLKYAIITLIYEITLAYLVALTIVGLGHIMGLP